MGLHVGPTLRCAHALDECYIYSLFCYIYIFIILLQMKLLVFPIQFSRSTSRAGSSVVLPQFLGNSQAQGRGHVLHSYHQQPNSTAVRFSSMRRSAGPRGSTPIGSMHSADHPGVFLVPSGSSGQNLVDAENNEGSRLYAWERDRFAPYPLAPVDSESNWWGQFHHVAGGSDSSSRTPYWHRHGTERQSSQGRTENPYQSSHAPRLHPFIWTAQDMKQTIYARKL